MRVAQYLVRREEDGRETWEDERVLNTVENCRQLMDAYNAKREAEDLAEKMKYQRYNILRKRDRRALEKGSIEKGNKPSRVIGLKRSKIGGESKGPLMCKVDWEPVTIMPTEKQSVQIDSTGASHSPRDADYFQNMQE